MGFNKRYINKESLISARNKGLDSLINLVKKPDCLIIDDEFSDRVCQIILNTEYMYLFTELSKIGFYDKKL
jgi:hypothetical protein